MTEQIGLLAGNVLAGGGDLFLPGVGSLYTESRPARRLPKRRLEPPCRVVSFTSQQRGRSLVDVIARTAQCDADAAQEIYDRWLLRAQQDDVLTLEGIGTLKFKHFTLDPAFDARLNPQGHVPVQLPARRLDWTVWFGIVAILIAVGIVGYLYLPACMAPAEPVVEEVAVELPAPAVLPADTIATDSLAVDTLSTPSPAITQPVPQPQSVGTAAEPAELVAGNRYVVLGVFSSTENAARAIADAVSKDASLRCGIYRFGGKFLVSPFSSVDADACTRFIREQSDRFPGMWTYTAR